MNDEQKRTLDFARSAFEKLKLLGQPATPRNYEIWYVYASASNHALNEVVNETVQRAGRLTDAELQQIYDTYLSPVRSVDRVSEVSTRMGSELDTVMSIIESARGANGALGLTLHGAEQSFAAGTDLDHVQDTIHALLLEVQSARDSNRALEERLMHSRQEIGGLRKHLDVICAESLTDPLTGLHNRKAFDRSIGIAIDHAYRSGEPLALLLLDIDHFKYFNDHFGHLTGDQVLRLVGTAMKQAVKGQDTTARNGGDEFAVVLPSTSLAQAHTVAEHIRDAVRSRELRKKSTGEILGRVTVSIGICELRAGDTTESFLERADTSLYAAKRAGRDCAMSDAEMIPVAKAG